MGEGKIKRIVIDTNVFISAILFGGGVNRMRQLWQQGKITYLLSGEVLKEYVRVMAYPKFGLSEKEIRYILDEELMPFITSVEVKSKVVHIKEDPDDDMFLALAIDGDADYIVSGDKHLLALNNYKGIKILGVREFLETC